MDKSVDATGKGMGGFYSSYVHFHNHVSTTTGASIEGGLKGGDGHEQIQGHF